MYGNRLPYVGLTSAKPLSRQQRRDVRQQRNRVDDVLFFFRPSTTDIVRLPDDLGHAEIFFKNQQYT
jgi:hypothetical protein